MLTILYRKATSICHYGLTIGKVAVRLAFQNYKSMGGVLWDFISQRRTLGNRKGKKFFRVLPNLIEIKIVLANESISISLER